MRPDRGYSRAEAAIPVHEDIDDHTIEEVRTPEAARNAVIGVLVHAEKKEEVVQSRTLELADIPQSRCPDVMDAMAW